MEKTRWEITLQVYEKTGRFLAIKNELVVCICDDIAEKG